MSLSATALERMKHSTLSSGKYAGLTVKEVEDLDEEPWAYFARQKGDAHASLRTYAKVLKASTSLNDEIMSDKNLQPATVEIKQKSGEVKAVKAAVQLAPKKQINGKIAVDVESKPVPEQSRAVAIATEPTFEEALRIILLFVMNLFGLSLPKQIYIFVAVAVKLMKGLGAVIFLTCVCYPRLGVRLLKVTSDYACYCVVNTSKALLKEVLGVPEQPMIMDWNTTASQMHFHPQHADQLISWISPIILSFVCGRFRSVPAAVTTAA